METKATFLLTVRCRFGHVTAFETEDASREVIEHNTEGRSYMTWEHAYIEWTCNHQECAERPWPARQNSIRL